MAFRRKFAPAIINSANVKGIQSQSSSSIDDGTVKSNAVAKNDLAYWIPVASPFLREGDVKKFQNSCSVGS